MTINRMIKELDSSCMQDIRRMFKEVFSATPWNEDWSDGEQLDNYLKDLTEVRNPLVFGLFDEDDLIGFSIGRIKHWCGGTEYYIEEFCIREDRQRKGYGREFFSLMETELKKRGLHSIYLTTERGMPAYEFYKKIGFKELPVIAAFVKEF